MEAVRMSFLRCWPSLLLLSAIKVESRLRRNVAANRPSTQVNTYADYDADFAVNGDFDGKQSCTGHAEYPWWSVDLGSFCSVAGVNVTNDKNAVYTERLDDFVVGLTNDSSDVAPPVFKSNYYVCAQYPGHVPPGATVYMACPPNAPLARYVIIQSSQPESDKAMCLIEVEVYVASFQWKKADGKRLVNNKVRDVAAASMMGCMTSCITDELCDSFNLRVADNACELNTHPDSGVPNGDLDTDDAWSWWAPGYTNLV